MIGNRWIIVMADDGVDGGEEVGGVGVREVRVQSVGCHGKYELSIC